MELDSLLLDTGTIFGLTSHYLKRKQKVNYSLSVCMFCYFIITYSYSISCQISFKPRCLLLSYLSNENMQK